MCTIFILFYYIRKTFLEEDVTSFIVVGTRFKKKNIVFNCFIAVIFGR